MKPYQSSLLQREGKEGPPLRAHLAGTRLAACPTVDPARFAAAAFAQWSDYSAPAERSSGERTVGAAAAAAPPPNEAAAAGGATLAWDRC